MLYYNKSKSYTKSFTKVDWKVDINVIIHHFIVNSRKLILSVLTNSGKDYKWKFFFFFNIIGRMQQRQRQLIFVMVGQQGTSEMGTNGCPDMEHISAGFDLLISIYPNGLFRKGQ